MHNKRHALELLELFKQSRLNARTEALEDPAEVKAGGKEEEVKVEGFSRTIIEPETGPVPTTSYLPKITPVQRKPSAMNIRKDTIVVGAVFIVALAGLSFLMGRRSTMLTPPPAPAEIASEKVPLEIPKAPAVDAQQAIVEVVAEEVTPPAAVQVDPRPEADQEKTAREKKEYIRLYQLATTGNDQEGAEEYREFLIGNGFDAFTHQVSDGRWTVRVRSYDETKEDLEKIRRLRYHNHYPFETAYAFARAKKSN